MRFEIREVTPELAEEWLKNRAPNRKLRGTVVDSYASDMSAGRWRLTHQGIAFDEAGRISDGQHRLAAIKVCRLHLAIKRENTEKHLAHLCSVAFKCTL